ncbi:MAG: 4-oxalocrotonate tautomerase family protein [Candidatus Bathyarchaeota archaeon]|nr:4-oxalocrotonate tautomerase family protein [Candidatus Bathyarchaeota archaeon]
MFCFKSELAVFDIFPTWNKANVKTLQPRMIPLGCARGGEDRKMPVVIVETWSGKSNEQKAKLIRGITRVFEEVGVTADQVQVIIHDVPKTNWGMYGEQTSKLPP